MSPSARRIPPETYFQKDEGISMKRVVTFRSTVKSTIESASESVTRYGYHFCFSVSDPARTMGRTGKTQGARMVSIPARNDAIKSVVIEMRKEYTYTM